MKNRLTETKYFKWGLTIFCVGAVLILFYQMVSRFSGFRAGLNTLQTIISPFIYGFVMSYLLGPIYNFVVRKTYPAFKAKTKKNKTALTISKVIATIISMLVLVGIIGGMVALLVPQIIESIRGIAQILPGSLSRFNDWMDGILGNVNSDTAETIQQYLDEIQNNVVAWVQGKLLPGMGTVVQTISSRLIVTIKTFFNVVVGIIVCAYFLNGKETFRAQFKKLVLAFAKEERAEEIFDFGSYANKTFGGFVTGKIIDSIIIGIICFIAMTILRLPYPILISTIVGITNIIPFFGPFIGAIPSLLIIVLVSPIQALIFLILIIVLQQLDGNVIGPAILGNSIGIASFWVMFSIILGGGLFGFLGMVLGVPVFAIIYYYFGKLVGKRLERRGYDKYTKDYIHYDKYNIDREEIIGEKDNEGTK